MNDSVTGLHGIPSSATWNWTYDDAYRLESENVDDASSFVRRTEFDWDDAGNREEMRKYADGSLVSTTDYDPASSLNQMTGWTCDQTNAVYLYDSNGARTDFVLSTTEGTKTTEYGYDEDNRLTSVAMINNAGKTNEYSFGYDYRTRRITRETPTEKTLHVFDGGLSVQEYDVSSNPQPQTSNLSSESIRGEGMGGGVGGMVYSVKNGQIKCSHSNHRGDIVARTGNNGSLTYFARYNAYGTRFHEVGATHDRQRGNTKDEETPLGLSFQGMRPLGLEHGVWLTPDPIGYGDGPNRYCYVHCNPITKFDPLGLTTKVSTGGKGLKVYYSEYLEQGDAGYEKNHEGYDIQAGKPMVYRKTYTDTLGFKSNTKGWGWTPARMNTLEGNYFSKNSNGDWAKVPLNKANDLSLSASELATVGKIAGAHADRIEKIASTVVDASMAPMMGSVKLLQGTGTLVKYGNAFLNGMMNSSMKQGVENGRVSLVKTTLDGVGGMAKTWLGSMSSKFFDSGKLDIGNSLNDMAAQQTSDAIIDSGIGAGTDAISDAITDDTE